MASTSPPLTSSSTGPLVAGPGLRPRPQHRAPRVARTLLLGPLGGFVPPIATAVLRTICRSMRLVEVRNDEFAATRILGDRKPVIFALWHSRMFYTFGHFEKRYLNHGAKFTTLVSSSKEGELITRTIQYMRSDVVRGSSSRHGREALYGLLERLKSGYCACVTPDGPRGPRQVAQTGVIALAQMSGLPLVPVTCGIRNAIIMRRSWDHFVFPIPYSPVRVLYGNPIHVPQDADDRTRGHYRRRLEDELNALTREADDWSTLRR